MAIAREAILTTAQDSDTGYPSRPLRLLTSRARGTGDTACQLLAPFLRARFGQPVVIENLPDGVEPALIVLDEPADGHTLMLVGSAIWLSPFMLDQVAFDPLKDLAPITMAVVSPNVLVVPPTLPARSVQELIELAKRKPGALSMAITNEGSSNHFSSEMFRSMADVDIERVRYHGANPAVKDLMDAGLSMLFVTATSSLTHIEAGRMRALAVTTANPSALLPGLPTIASQGLPGYSSGATMGLMARAGTPQAIIDRLHREVAGFLKQPSTTKALLEAGVDVVASTPEEFAGFIAEEMRVKGEIARRVGMRMAG